MKKHKLSNGISRLASVMANKAFSFAELVITFESFEFFPCLSHCYFALIIGDRLSTIFATQPRQKDSYMRVPIVGSLRDRIIPQPFIMFETLKRR